MRHSSHDSLLRFVESFFREHLQRVRGASPHTVLAYRDSLSLFFRFLADSSGRPVSKLTTDDIETHRVLAFLDHLESERGNSAATRNCRLAAVRCLVEHLLRHDPIRAAQYHRILAIPTKKARVAAVTYLEPEEVEVLLRQPDLQTQSGRRDRALMVFLYNTGARVSEALAVRRHEIVLERPARVRLCGKGAKDRICPLWKETVSALEDLTEIGGDPGDPVFLNARGHPLTRDGVAYVLHKHARRAACEMPALERRRITPHVLRHSCAVALLQAGIDVATIRDYLGHASVATTSRYITTNLRMKRDALEAFWKRAGLKGMPAGKGRRSWRPTPDVLAFLSSL